ncbi:hypothetical protein [Deinococcus kurensis]|uniref:hypothetical protein n=1 Tax=Deinococcus kurensis TaxID=2662757 RepID=UPI0012D2F5D7|nr:hypothetical protein [Deinococcus kurensis]
MTPDAQAIQTGWRFTTALLGTLCLTSLVSTLLVILAGRSPVPPLISLALTGWLCWNVYQGRDWARVVVALLLLWTGAQLLLGGVAVTVVLGGLHMLAAALLFTPGVRTYMAYARQL